VGAFNACLENYCGFHPYSSTPTRAHRAEKMTSKLHLLIAGVAIVVLVARFKDATPPEVAPCPETLQTIDVPGFYTGKYDNYKVLRILHEGRQRGLTCAGQRACPALPRKELTLQLTVDACTLRGKANKLTVYQMSLIEEGTQTVVFPVSSSKGGSAPATQLESIE
jgi:hypothetical protein